MAIRVAISSAAAFRARSAFLGTAFAGVPAFWSTVDPAARTVFFGGGVRLAANVLVAGGILFGTTLRTTGPPGVRTAGGFLTGGTVPASFVTGSFATSSVAIGGFATAGFATGGFGDGEFATTAFTIGVVTVGDVTVFPGDRFVAVADNIVGSSSTVGIGFCRSAGSGGVVFAIG